VNVEAKGRYQVQKRITQHEQLRVIFGLMPAFFFIFFAPAWFSSTAFFIGILLDSEEET